MSRLTIRKSGALALALCTGAGCYGVRSPVKPDSGSKVAVSMNGDAGAAAGQAGRSNQQIGTGGAAAGGNTVGVSGASGLASAGSGGAAGSQLGCSQAGDACCDGACAMGLVCNGIVCLVCGGVGQRCCAGNNCEGAACCDHDICVGAGLGCNAGDGTCSAGRCSGCGALHAGCCGRVCYDANAACTASEALTSEVGTCELCGHAGEICCRSPTGGTCGSGLICEGAGHATCMPCGAPGQIRCP